jgi:acetylornithine/N-succinyldiaminopimelate aminotransferase
MSTVGHTQQELVELAQRYLYPNYRQPPVVMSNGKGCEVWDEQGNRYLDLTAGIAVNALGHAHPALVDAIARQAATLGHVSNYFYNAPNILLAQKLCQVTRMDRAFFCNSGTEAIEASLKLARRHFFGQGQPERNKIVAFNRSFHGRTMGALAATGQAGYRDGFGPLGPVTHVDYGDGAAVAAAMAPDVAAILVEPVQGEGGVIPAPAGFSSQLREIADAHGALLIADEIQTGIGRTGKMLAFEHFGVQADVVALAKGLGGGFPSGAMVCKAALEGALPAGSHGTTFGGNPLASATALCVLEQIEKLELLDAVEACGAYLADKLETLQKKHPSKVVGSRGLGLLRALELGAKYDTREVIATLRDAGLLLTAAGGSALRFSPALVVSQRELDEACGILDTVLGGLA